MLVVIDTNVLVSSMLNPSGVPSAVLSLVVEEKIVPCYDARIMREYREVLSRPKFGFDAVDVGAHLEAIRELGLPVAAGGMRVHGVRHEDDVPFAQVALAASASILITGNTSHYPSNLGSTHVLTPRAFLDEYIGE